MYYYLEHNKTLKHKGDKTIEINCATKDTSSSMGILGDINWLSLSLDSFKLKCKKTLKVLKITIS